MMAIDKWDLIDYFDGNTISTHYPNKQINSYKCAMAEQCLKVKEHVLLMDNGEFTGTEAILGSKLIIMEKKYEWDKMDKFLEKRFKDANLIGAK